MPLLRPALLVALIFRTLDSFRVFDVIYVMKGIAPETVSVAILARRPCSTCDAWAKAPR